MQRRQFINRAGFLLGSLGLPSSFKMDLMDKLMRSMNPEAMAGAAQPVRVLEICLRMGVPFLQFGTGQEFAKLPSAKYANFAYSGNGIIPATGVSNLYLNKDSASLLKHANNIAITSGIASDGAHTNDFNIRKGATAMGLVAPIVELANNNSTGSLLTGVKWPGDTVNQTGGGRDLTHVTNSQDFINTFKNQRLQMTNPELGAVLTAAQKLSHSQAVQLEDRLKDSLQQYQIHSNAVQTFSADYGALLQTQSLPEGLDPKVNVPPPCCSSQTYDVVQNGIGLSLKAMQHNLINSAMVVVELGDWHSFQQIGSMNYVTKALSDTISGTLDFLKATSDPASLTGQTLWDTTTVMLTSEFNRGLTPFGMDNSDGDTQGLILIGKNVRGNYYGSFDLSGSGKGSAFGFDNVTGQGVKGMNNSTLQAYYTIRKALRLPLEFTQAQAAFNAMLTI